jgi:ferredoxin-NADP reductase
MSAAESSTTLASPVDRSHAVVTAASPRAPTLFPARITTVQPLSPTVLRLLLAVDGAHRGAAAFQPGQWVDFHVPDSTLIGGYSICSTPRTLMEDGVIELAVKRSTHPPAAWVHASAKPGVDVQMQVGGSFVYDAEEARRQGLLPVETKEDATTSAGADPAAAAAAASAAAPPLTPPDSAPALFVVGGVGITPMISMAHYRAERVSATANKDSSSAPVSDASSTFIFSAREENELVFRAELESIAAAAPATAPFRLYLSTTAGTGGKHAEGEWKLAPELNAGRVPLALLRAELERVANAKGHCYLCGPPQMVDELLPIVQKHIQDSRRVHFERWW